jgi:hypothetical protein
VPAEACAVAVGHLCRVAGRQAGELKAAPSADTVMTAVTVCLIFDRAAAPSLGVTVGPGWARVTVTSANPAPGWGAVLPPSFRTVINMLVAAAVTVPVSMPHLSLGGIDAPVPGSDADRDTRDSVQTAWGVAAREVAARLARELALEAELPGAGFSGFAAGQESPSEEPEPAETVAAGPAENAVAAALAPLRLAPNPGSREGRGAPSRARAARAETELVDSMVATIKSYMKTYGAAPDFGSPSSREKAYNYIRSTAAQPTASPAVLEKVRQRLAGRQ